MSDWRHAAVCRDHDPEAFFSVSNPKSEAYKKHIKAAKAICRGCPVREDCLTYALSKDVTGVFGATDEHDRQRLRRQKKVTIS